MFLSPEELYELTGRRRKDAQVTALCHMGIEHRVRRDGTPAVLEAHVYKEFGAAEAAQADRRKEPNWNDM